MAGHTRIVLDFSLFGALLRWEDGTARPPSAELSLADLASLRQTIDDRLTQAAEAGAALPADGIFGTPGAYTCDARALGY